MKKLKYQWCCLFHVGRWQLTWTGQQPQIAWCPTCKAWRDI